MDCNFQEYELFVKNLFNAIILLEQTGIQKNINIEHNKKMLDKSGIERQFDIYWKYELAGIEYETIIECKNYSSTVTIDKIDALIGKLHDFPNIRGVFATTQGYQSGAIEKAKQNNIDLLIVRKEKDDDWIDEDGNPLIKKIIVNLIVSMPPIITSIEVGIGENDCLNSQNLISRMVLDNKLIINDNYNQDKYSIYEAIVKDKFNLGLQSDKAYGDINTKEISFQDAYFELDGITQKFAKLTIKYIINEPIKHDIIVESYIEGVIEYLFKDKKSFITTDGKVFYRNTK